MWEVWYLLSSSGEIYLRETTSKEMRSARSKRVLGGGENTGDVGYKESCERSKGIVKVVRTLENLWTKFTVSKETLRRNSMVTVKEVERNTTGER